MDAAPHDERPRGAVPQPTEQHRQHQVAVREQPCPCGCRRAGCRGSRAASATASCATAARSPGATRRCTATRSSAGTGSRAAARRRSRCSCSRRSRRRSGPRSRRPRPAPRATSGGSGAANTSSTMCAARWFAITTFRKRPVTIRKNARPVSTRRGSRGSSSCGSSSLARTIGPATRCGKNAWKTANRVERRRHELAAIRVDDVRDRHERVEGDADRQRHVRRATTSRCTLSTELRKKFVYLKYARIPRSNATARPRNALRALRCRRAMDRDARASGSRRSTRRAGRRSASPTTRRRRSSRRG